MVGDRGLLGVKLVGVKLVEREAAGLRLVVPDVPAQIAGLGSTMWRHVKQQRRQFVRTAWLSGEDGMCPMAKAASQAATATRSSASISFAAMGLSDRGFWPVISS